MTTDDVERRAWAYLSRVAEPPCPRLTTLVAACGPVEAADMIRRGLEDKDLTGKVAARREVDCAARDLEILDRRGGRLITPDDDEWPYLSFVAFGNKAVRDLPSGYPPMVLWALGPARLDEIAERAAAIVGTRACTSYGEHITAEIAAGLVERDAAVVSGGAYGIDGAAHRATLASDGVTVAVLAGGVDVPYPSGHSALLHRVATSGLLLSEYPPGAADAVPFPDAKSLGGGLVWRDGSGGGGAAQWGGQYSCVGERDGPQGLCGAGAGDVGRLGGMPRPHPQRRGPGRQGGAGRRIDRPHRRTRRRPRASGDAAG